MAIDPADLKKIDGLVVDSSLEFDQYLPQAKGGAVPTAILTETLLRQRVSLSLDRSGFATSSLVYDTYNNATLTIDQDNTLTVGTLKTNETVFLTVNKGLTDILTFNGLSAGVDSIQQGKTVCYFRIDSINGYEIVTQLNSQHDDSLVIGNLTPTGATVNSLSYWISTINNDICHFEASFQITSTVPANVLLLTIANWDVTKVNTGYISCNSICYTGSTHIVSNAQIKSDGLRIELGTSTGSAVDVLVSGTFKVK